MDIVKELNLNRNPKAVSNGSLVCAKNIKLSADGSFITNDDGFSSAIVTAESVDELKISNVTLPEEPITVLYGSIVGYINMPNEIVIFCYTFTEAPRYNYIYRLIERKDGTGVVVIPVNSSWRYTINSTIIGTGYYNSNNELIIAVAENVDDVEIPLKVINLNTCDGSDNPTSYTINPDVPIANLMYIGREYGGTIPNGTYNFFIRYKISEDNYTNWFPIGRTYHATNPKETIIVSTGQVIYKNTRKEKTIIKFPVGNDDDCNYNPMFEINFDSYFFYKEFQIGYIIQHDGSLVGRIWKNFNISTNKFAFDAKYIKEENITNFVKNVFGLYNVKSLTSFKNKLYLANYKETDYNDDIDENIVNAIEPYYKIVPSNINENREISSNTKRYTFSCKNETYTIDNYSNEQLTLYNVLSDANLFRLFFLNAMNLGLPAFNADDLYIKDNGTYYKIDKWIIINNNSTALANVQIQRLDQYGSPIGSPKGTWTFGVKNGTNYTDLEYTTAAPKRTVKVKVETLIPEVYKAAQALSLDEGEVYSFYVHYVRRDGSYTNGYPIYLQNDKSLGEAIETPGQHDSSPTNNLYRYYKYKTESSNDKYICRTGYTSDSVTDVVNVLYPVFTNIQIPNGYVGVFFSYEKVEPRKLFSGIINYVGQYPNVSPTSYYYKIHALGPELGLSDYKCDKIRYNNSFYNVVDSEIKISNNYDDNVFASTLGKEGGIFITLESDLGITKANNYDKATSIINNVVGYNKNNNIYNKKDKELISLGHIITKIGDAPLTYDSTQYDCNLPNYIQKEYKVIVNPKFSAFETINIPYLGIIIIDSSDYIEIYLTGGDGTETTLDYREAKDNNNPKYPFPYYIACSFYNNSRYDFNAIIYKEAPQLIKTVKEGITTVVKPDNLSDLFQYKNSFNNNPVKIYSEYNDSRLNNYIVTNVIRRSYSYRSEGIDLPWKHFDSEDYKVLDFKYGPIVNLLGIGNNLFIHTTNTLCYITSDAKLQADNTSISIANHDIYDLDPVDIFPSDLGYGGLKYIDCQLYCQYGYIWYDTEHRKLFRFDNNKLEDLTANIQEIVDYFTFEKCYINIDNEFNRIFIAFEADINDNKEYLTLAFSSITNKFISIMDFKFDMALHTTNTVYFALKRQGYLCKYDKSSNPAFYDELVNIFPLFDFNNSVEQSFGQSIIDVIFNESYEIIKNVESISLIHNIINVSNRFDNIYSLFKNSNDIEYNKDLIGISIQLYTDRTRTDILPLYKQPSETEIEDYKNKNNIFDTNHLDAYKYPWYNKGIWQFNYFRDVLNKKIADAYTHSDDQSLIYGKFVIVRFIYNGETGKRLKLDNLSVNFNRY